MNLPPKSSLMERSKTFREGEEKKEVEFLSTSLSCLKEM